MHKIRLFLTLLLISCPLILSAQGDRINVGLRTGHNTAFGGFAAVSVEATQTLCGNLAVNGGLQYNTIGKTAIEARPTYGIPLKRGRISVECLLTYTNLSSINNFTAGAGATLDSKYLSFRCGYYYRLYCNQGGKIKEPFNIYISGLDVSGTIDVTSRSDVNMIMTVNPVTKKILLTSIPRDSYVMLHTYQEMDKLTHTGVYGVDETDAARAALLHDITKALDGPLQLTLCQSYGTILDDFSQRNPKTLHALTGSLVAQRIFGENQAVVDAIRCHTTGKADMNTLEKIIYVADYMEPNRDFPGVDMLRDLAYRDITKALKLGLQMTLEMLYEQKRDISPESLEAYYYLKDRGV